MIDIKKLTEEDIGRKVSYLKEPYTYMEGRIVSWSSNHMWIYVRYLNPHKAWLGHNGEDNYVTGLSTWCYNLEFKKPTKIITRAELFIFDDEE